MTESAEGTQTDASWVTAKAPAPPMAGAVGEVLVAEVCEGGGGALARAGKMSAGEAILAAPARMQASFAQRKAQILEQVAAEVPLERRVAAPASLAAPIMERLKYLEDENPLRALYIRLLTSAVDGQTQGDAHPAFVTLIEQLSRDEAVLLMCLKQRDLLLTKKNRGYDPGRPKSGTTFFLPNIAPDIDAEEVPKGLVEYPQHIKMYLSHLLSMNLIKIKPPPVVDHRIEWLTWLVCPSDFGGLFLSACVPGPSGAKR